jgi:antitoxin component of RelBE/YafQ-DinJ toxin-antitoxin module
VLILNVVTKKRELKLVATKVVKEEVVRVRVDKDLKDRFKKMCKDKKVTMSEMITFMIENEVESYEFKLKNSDDTEKRIVVTEKKLLKLKEKLNSNKKEIGMKSRWRF